MTAIARPTYSIDEVEHPIVKSAVSYWQSVKAQRRFPARADLTLRGMASFLPYTLIVAVIEDGADYEYRFVGEVERQAFKRNFKGMRVSQVERIAPKFGEIIRATYDRVSSTGLPFAVRRTRRSCQDRRVYAASRDGFSSARRCGWIG